MLALLILLADLDGMQKGGLLFMAGWATLCQLARLDNRINRLARDPYLEL